MDVTEAIRARRAVKKFDPDHQLTDWEVKDLMQLARLAPAAFNIQHCRFVTVTDPELAQQIRTVSWDQAQVTDCSLLVIVCADVMAWQKHAERLWQDAPEAAQAFMKNAIHDYYNGKPVVQRDEALRSCGLAAQTIMLAAKGMGYDSCPMDGFDFEAVAKLINLPDDHIISMFVAVGKALEDGKPRPGHMEYEEMVIEDRF